MKRLLFLLTLILGFVFGSTNGSFVSPGPAGETAMEQTMQTRDDVPPPAGTFDVPQGRQPRNGLIADGRGLSRLGGTRPSRVLASHGQGHQRTSARISFACRTASHTLKHLFDGRRLETAPFQSAVSRTYYIIALRRLII